MKRTVRLLLAGSVTSLASFIGLVGFAPAAHAALVQASPCPSGYQGVTLSVDNHDAMVCENIVP